MNYLAPSLLAADFARLDEQLKAMEKAGASYLHLDVMDGAFVPNISFGFPVVKSLRPVSGLVFDMHMMVQEPIRYLVQAAEAGADLITVHAEACTHLDRTVTTIRELGKRAAVALNPATDLSVLDYILPKLDMVLIMTVNPGYGGQTYLDYCTEKIKDLKQIIEKKGLKTDIEADGGIGMDNIEEVLNAGANVIVAGSALFKGDISNNIRVFLEKMK